MSACFATQYKESRDRAKAWEAVRSGKYQAAVHRRKCICALRGPTGGEPLIPMRSAADSLDKMNLIFALFDFMVSYGEGGYSALLVA